MVLALHAWVLHESKQNEPSTTGSAFHLLSYCPNWQRRGRGHTGVGEFRQSTPWVMSDVMGVLEENVGNVL